MKPTKVKNTNPLWGGRFDSSPSRIMQQINASIEIDKRFFREDIQGSKVHARMLAKQGLLSHKEAKAILAGLSQIEKEIQSGKMTFDPKFEDIHMHIERRLQEIIGAIAGKLHTARSRNDQVATDLRLWLRGMIDQLTDQLSQLRLNLLEKAELEVETLMPGFTHLQPAQPITFAHHLMAYVEMFERDQGRLSDCRRRLNESPLGAAALAGTRFPIDRHWSAEQLGFSGPMRNSLDAVSSRDFALEYAGVLSILAMHLSRLAEEIVLWCSDQFRFVKLSDAFTTGSSIMPQKRNPDAAELIRGKAGVPMAVFQQLCVMLKGLPLAYGKDMQEDKAPLFRASDDMALCLSAMAGMIADLKPDRARMALACQSGFLTATDLADWLVIRYKLPFREAHHIAGKIVRLAEKKPCRLSELSLEEMRTVAPMLKKDVLDILDEKTALGARNSFGGTAPSQVKQAIKRARKRI